MQTPFGYSKIQSEEKEMELTRLEDEMKLAISYIVLPTPLSILQHICIPIIQDSTENVNQ